jgi:hypothetical protein
VAAGCSALGGSLGKTIASQSPLPTVPPPAASQAPGPPLATASAPVAGTGAPPDPADPIAVAGYCFARWQSFDARTDTSLGAGVQRADAAGCFTPDFLEQLTAGQAAASAGAAGQAWGDLKAQGARSTVMVLAVTPLGDTAATGRVVYLLNVRTTYTTDNATTVQNVSTPTVTLLRDTSGRWQIAGADLAANAGAAPGR